MGNYRFRLSDMLPNAWFYKLKDMAKTRHHTIPHPINNTKKLHPTRTTETATATSLSHHRHSYYYSSDHPNRDKFHTSPTNLKASDTPFPDPPRKSKKKAKRKSSRSSSKLISSSVTAGCSCRTSFDSVRKPDASSLASFDSPPLLPNASLVPTSAPAVVDAFDSISSWSSSCSCRVSSSATDIIIDVDSKNSFQRSKFDEFDSLLELELPPVLTKPAKLKETETMQFRERFIELKERNGSGSVCVKVLKEGSSKTLKEDKSPARRFSSPAFHGLKMRANSPRLASKKIQAYNRKSTSMTANQRARRKSVSDSFAVVKSSLDPQRDFRESMVEMILENNIRTSKDLEDLLACYLSLNSNEYHDLIVKVFEEIWFDLTDIQL